MLFISFHMPRNVIGKKKADIFRKLTAWQPNSSDRWLLGLQTADRYNYIYLITCPEHS